jgi:EmrB/QacA subfamily drug resistance transporter
MTAIAPAVFLAALDQTIVATALPTIAAQMGSLTALAAVVTSYLLAACIATPIAGRCGDLYGRRAVFLAAVGLFGLGSLACGLAGTMPVLLVGRAIQGAGGGALMTLALAIVAESFPANARARYQGFLGSIFGLASIAGPLIGGVVTDALSWRYLFLINLPCCAGILLAGLLSIPKVAPQAQSWLDVPGIILLTVTLVCLVLTLQWGGSTESWTSPLMLALICGTLFGGLAFILVERGVQQPLVPLRLLRDPYLLAPMIVGALAAMSLFTAVTYLPLLYQYALSAGVSVSGLLLAPFMATVVVVSTVAGSLASRWDSYRFFPLAGTILALAGMLLFAQLGPGSTHLQAVFAMVVFGAGIGMTMQMIVLAAQDRLARQDLGIGTALVMLARSIGAIAAVALFGSLFAIFYVTHAPAALPDLGTLTPEQLGALDPALALAVSEAVARSLRSVFLLGAVPMSLAVVAAAFTAYSSRRRANRQHG